VAKVEKIKTKVKKDKGDPAKRAAAAAARRGLVAQLDGSVEADSEKAKEEAVLGTKGVDGVAEKLQDATVE
jgi:hypothetical protein